MKNFKKARSQGGFSLIELLLTLVIIAALAVAAFIVYPRVQAGRNATYEAQVLSAAQAGVKALFTTNNYDRLSVATAINADIFPANMIVDGAIQNQWGGSVDIGPSAANGGSATAVGTPDRYFKITYRQVPTDVCIRLAGAAAQNFGTILIGLNPDASPGTDAANTAQDLYSPTRVPLNEATIANRCKGTDGRAAITFVSN